MTWLAGSRQKRALQFAALGIAALAGSAAAGVVAPCGDPGGEGAERAEAALAATTQGEKLGLVHGVLAAPSPGKPKPEGALGSAGFVPGVPRLGVPALQETDAGTRRRQSGRHPPRRHGDRNAVRSGARCDLRPRARAPAREKASAPRRGEKGSTSCSAETANLIRDPRGGRTFEYLSEDPLLTGLMAGAAVEGVESQHVLSTVKHFALNDQENDRRRLDVRIDRAAARKSDLLAFEVAIERGKPGAVMCAYNAVNGVHACENSWLLGDVLKGDWGFRGFVLSDWGAVPSTVQRRARGARPGIGRGSRRPSPIFADTRA